jgi:hypothetical protein
MSIFKITTEAIAELYLLKVSEVIRPQPHGLGIKNSGSGLNAVVLVTRLERQLLCLIIPKMQVWLESYLFNLHEMF